MKIAFLVGEFPSLSETFILNQMTGLIDLGHDIAIYAIQPQIGQTIHPDVDTYQLLDRTYYAPCLPRNFFWRLLRALGLLAVRGLTAPRVCLQTLNIWAYGRDAYSLRLLYAVIPFLRNQRPHYDIIHCHFGPEGIKGARLVKMGAVSGHLSTTFHGWDMSCFLQEMGAHIYDELFAQGDLFLPISDHWQRRLIELGCAPAQTVVHHMGINCDDFTCPLRQPVVGAGVKFISVARLVEKKGIEYSIRAIAQLKVHHPHIQYQIIGGGALTASLQALTHELGAADVIEFMGWQEKRVVMECLQTAHILLAPSVTSQDGDQEGIPVALMEAMAMGLVVVSTDHSGIPELIEDGVSGVLVPERDVAALVQRLQELVEAPESWQSLTDAGRHCVQEAFNIYVLNQRLSDLFVQVVHGR